MRFLLLYVHFKVEDLRDLTSRLENQADSEEICAKLQDRLEQAKDMHIPLVVLEAPLERYRKIKTDKKVLALR